MLHVPDYRSDSEHISYPQCCCYLIAQSCPTLCDPMDSSTLGFPVLHHFQESAQTHVHWVSDAIQPSYPLSSPFSPAFNLTSPLTWACRPAYLEILEPWYPYTAVLNYLLNTWQSNHQPQIQNMNPDCKRSSYHIIKGTDTSKHNERILTYDFLPEWGE